MSLEVVELIPPADGETFLTTLTQLGRGTDLSAAIPRRGGRGHVDERRQDYRVEDLRVVAALPVLVGNAIRRRLRPKGERGDQSASPRREARDGGQVAGDAAASPATSVLSPPSARPIGAAPAA